VGRAKADEASPVNRTASRAVKEARWPTAPPRRFRNGLRRRL